MSDFSEHIKISEKMVDVINRVIQKDYTYVWLEGSAQCGKSVTAALAFALRVENASKEDTLFITLGYTESSAINNCWKCGGFGIQDYFGSRCERGLYPGTNIKCLKIKTKTGMKYVLAFGTSTKTANNAWHGFRVSGFLFDEIDRSCEESIVEMQQRITAVEDPFVICTQNPNVPSHPIYTFLNNLISKEKCYWTHWVLDDNIGLSAAKIQAVKSMYDPTSIYYRRYINGERVNPEGAVYNIRDYNIIEDFDPEDYIDYITVADPGVNSSATGFVLLALRYNYDSYTYQVDILKDYRHQNKEQRGLAIKMPKDYANDYCQFIKEAYALMGNRYPSVIYIDEDLTFYRELRLACMEYEINYGLVKYVIKDDIEQRIKHSVNALFSAKLRFYKECKNTIETFKNAVYDEKKAEQGKYVYLDEPQHGTEIDLVDAACYGLNHYLNKIYMK